MSSDSPVAGLGWLAPDVQQVAVEAANRWIHGAATGDWQPLLVMLAEDVRFAVPVAAFVPGGTGRAEAARFFAFLASTLRTSLTIKSMLSNGNLIGFEIRAEGVIDGQPHANNLFLVMEIRDGAVAAFREYLAWPGGLPDLSGGRDKIG